MGPWYEEGKWLELPPIEALRLCPHSTNGVSLASTTNLEGVVASPTSPEMHWLSGVPPPASTQLQPAIFQSMQPPQLVGHQYTGETGSAPHLQWHWPLPYGDTENRVGHWALPDFGYWPAPAATLEPGPRRNCVCPPTKRSKPVDVEDVQMINVDKCSTCHIC
jgi:hypothetical protein